MYCISCGQQISKADWFCWKCGAPIPRMGQTDSTAPTPSAQRHAAIGFISIGLAIASLALSIASVSGLTFRLLAFGEVAWALFAAVVAFVLGTLGASPKSRKTLHASLGMYLAVVALAIQAFSTFLWLGLHAL